MHIGGFPCKCQLAAKGISISHRRTGGVLLVMPLIDLRVASPAFHQ